MIDRFLGRVALRPALACSLLILLCLLVDLPGFASLFPMDRDEPRFAQASKQMLETGDFVNIRLQDVARNKKPVGIYWLQAASVATAEHLGVPEARAQIWLYRLPSLAGAILVVLLTYWTALALTTRRAALIAGVFTACVPLLVVEAHLAKTDAVLCATVMAGMGILARAWVRRSEPHPLSFFECVVFWTAMAGGILIKGPITPMVALFASLVLSIGVRSGRWLRALRPGWGVLWCLLLVLPWFILIVQNSGMAFFQESIGHDMAGKVAGVQEAHGAPPGTYFLAFWLTAWPLAPFALLAALTAWCERKTDAVFFLLAWIVPYWLAFELFPTKLPHYVLPTYPAIAILTAFAAETGFAPRPVGRWRFGIFAAFMLVLPLAIPIALPFVKGRVTSSIDAGTYALAIAAAVIAVAAGWFATRAVRNGQVAAAALAAFVAGAVLFGFILGRVMNEAHADLIAISPRLAKAGRAAFDPACSGGTFATAGDGEPSLVFSTATNLMITDPAGAAGFLKGGPCRAAFVNKPMEPAFSVALGDDGRVHLASRVLGFNINGGKPLDIGVYVRQEDRP